MEPDLATFPDALRGKRILLCTESFGPVNGVSRTTLMLVNHLRANGVDVAVVAPHTGEKTFTPEPTSQAANQAKQKNADVRVHGYPLPYNPELSVVYPVRVSTLYKRTFGAAPDLIYLASPASLGFQVMLQIRQQPPARQTPIICNFQTDLAAYCTILFPQPFSTLAVAALATVQGFLFRHASVKTIFYPSRAVRRYLASSGQQGGGVRCPAAKLELLQRGVDTQLFHPSRRSDALRAQVAPAGEIVLICVSRLAGEKGFGFLADAAAALDRRGLPFRLMIVGGNRSAAVEAEIKGLFAPLVQRGKVVFAGFLVGEKLAAAYASADIFLHCSVTETFGLVVLESMASGVPVVARDEGGPSDIVRDGESGFLTPPADLDAFVDKVMMLAEDAELRRRCGENARRQAEEATWERINNRVAWRMAEMIEQSRKEKAELLAQRKAKAQDDGLPAEEQSLLPKDAVRDTVIDARLAGGMVAISATWVAVGAYLIFIKVGLWVKARFRSWFAREAASTQ
ncbi:glycosyltransferase family 4 protein [Thermothielavioides terrestris NRRL 8126]|uniref:Glycosyltransferase family 4 protein n=1 Tax=Thermothielavioides terrestris (strain ATCC 38088 / NRRL 8126) TaxID=578455 RepID=G2R0M1_THETT|nr:glycosyltransferase family 4 protein [Thermothielavioides terrestris NRRL 8126]AEO66489.1 glycosyltransferase family 4 protein [Thermothielavioides terrestris NRRL 8126]